MFIALLAFLYNDCVMKKRELSNLLYFLDRNICFIFCYIDYIYVVNFIFLRIYYAFIKI